MKVFELIDPNESQFNAMFPGHEKVDENPVSKILFPETKLEKSTYFTSLNMSDSTRYTKFFVKEYNIKKSDIIVYFKEVCRHWGINLDVEDFENEIDLAITAANQFEVGDLVKISKGKLTKVKK